MAQAALPCCLAYVKQNAGIKQGDKRTKIKRGLYRTDQYKPQAHRSLNQKTIQLSNESKVKVSVPIDEYHRSTSCQNLQ